MVITKRGGVRFSWIAIASLFVIQLGAAEPGNSYLVTNLVSDGSVPANRIDSLLINAWGIAALGMGPWWVNANGGDLSAIYDQNGADGIANLPFVHVSGAPTGIVGHLGAGFLVSNGTQSAPAVFLFATENGTILGWNPTVGTPPSPSNQSFVVVPNPNASVADAVFKGLTLATTPSGDFLYAADFHHNQIDVFDSTFTLVTNPGSFIDPKLPKGFAPFGIQNIQNKILVAYAKQDEAAHDDVAGDGLGFVDAFDADGTFLARIASRGALNAPWGMAMAPANFGRFSNRLLVGNFGNGRINVFDPQTFEPLGQLKDPTGKPIVIDGLWGIGFGNGGKAGPTNVLYFAAGPHEESGGLYGKICSSEESNCP